MPPWPSRADISAVHRRRFMPSISAGMTLINAPRMVDDTAYRRDFINTIAHARSADSHDKYRAICEGHGRST